VRAGPLHAQGGEQPGEPSLFALPLVLQERRLGGIVLEVEPTAVFVEGSDRTFLDALASEMAVALDRVRLIGRERERQREEKRSWRRRSPTCGASCTAPGSPTAPG
jgi:GAF domain-containing protein